MTRFLAALGVVAATPLLAYAQPQFSWIGTLQGGTFSHLSAVSADGLYTVGWSGSASGVRAFRRTHYQGMVTLGSMPGGGDTFATGVSNYGATVVGWGVQGGAPVPFSWTAAGGLTPMALPPGDTWGRAYDISSSGEWVVGQTGNETSTYATVWHNGAPSHLAPPSGATLSTASAVNDAGNAAGYAEMDDGDVVPVRWSAGVPTVLLYSSVHAQALALSENSVAFGGGMNEIASDLPLKWTGAAPVTLPLPATSSATSGIATAVNATGLIYAGSGYLQAPEVFLSGGTVGGTRTLSNYLVQSGVSFTGIPNTVSGINGAGTVFVGNGMYFDAPVGWLLRTPGAPSVCPADLGTTGGLVGNDGVLDNNDFVAFISLFFLADPRADLGSTGAVRASDGRFDNNDFVVFIDQFFGGCP